MDKIKIKLSAADKIKADRSANAPGIFPGMNRARTFVNRKKQANKRACRKKVDI